MNSLFVYVSEPNLWVGREIRSCTNTVKAATPFELDGRRIILIDAPGFDDATESETDVPGMITAFLATSKVQPEHNSCTQIMNVAAQLQASFTSTGHPIRRRVGYR